MTTSTHVLIPDDEKPRSNSGRPGITPRYPAHGGYGPLFGHLSAGTDPDKTYLQPGKADTMAKDTYGILLDARATLGTEAQAVPCAEILPYVKAFNRAKTRKAKNLQLNLLKQHVNQYRKDHHDKNDGPDNPGYCPAEFATCR